MSCPSQYCALCHARYNIMHRVMPHLDFGSSRAQTGPTISCFKPVRQTQPIWAGLAATFDNIQKWCFFCVRLAQLRVSRGAQVWWSRCCLSTNTEIALAIHCICMVRVLYFSFLDCPIDIGLSVSVWVTCYIWLEERIIKARNKDDQLTTKFKKSPYRIGSWHLT